MTKNSINKTLQHRNFVRFSEEIDKIIKPIESTLDGVLTYHKDNDNYISEKFFNNQCSEIFQQDIDNAHMFISQYRNQLKRLKHELLLEESLNELQKKTLLNIIQGLILRSLWLHYAVYIEAEKGGFPLDQEKKTTYLKKIKNIETVIYGPSISSNSQEVALIMSNLDHLFSKKSDLLNSEDHETFKNFLDKFPERTAIQSRKKAPPTLGKIPIIDVCHLFQKIVTLYNIHSKIIIIDKNIDDVKEENDILSIPSTYDQLAIKKIYKEHNLEETVKIILDPKVFGFGVGDYSLDVPASTETVSVKRICELIDHEITTHFVKMINKKEITKIKTDSALRTEEGFAMMNELLATGDATSLTKDKPTIHHISTFIGENYDFEKTKELLKIYYILQGNSPERAEKIAEKRGLRVKRYHAFDRPGANPKDSVYRRGLLDAVSYIEALDINKIDDLKKLEKDMVTFYLSKLGQEELKDSDTVFEGFNIDNNDIIMPIALGKIIYQKLLGNAIDPNQDIRFLAFTQKLNYKQKKLVLEILSFIKSSSST